MNRPKVLAVGLDGASFNLIHSFLERGALPHFAKLAAEGVSGELESCIPPVTMPAWRVYSTGKYPGKLGVYWHQQLNPQTLEVITPNATHFQSADLWDYLNLAGYRTGVVGMPGTYPPRPLDGFMVCSGPNTGDTGYTFPDRLAAELERVIQYHPNVKADLFQNTEHSSTVDKLINTVDHAFAAAEYLMEREPVDFLQVTTYDLNRLQHFCFDGEPVFRAWQIIDAWLGKLTPRFDYTFVMSDHGTERLERAFYLNVWLRQNGYLRTRRHPVDILPALGINRTNVGRLMQSLGLVRLFSFQTLVKYGSMLPRDTGGFGEFGNQFVAQRINWKETRILALPQGPIYINRNLVRDEEEYERLRDDLIERLEALSDPLTHQRVFKKVYRREELYHGQYLEQAPHLVALSFDGFHNRAGLNQDDVFAPSWKWKGNNRHNGLFVISGPGIRRGVTLSGVRIVDLAPTLLWLCGVAVPNDMDGRVLDEALDSESGAGPSRVVFQESLLVKQTNVAVADYEEIVAARLKDLGYL